MHGKTIFDEDGNLRKSFHDEEIYQPEGPDIQKHRRRIFNIRKNAEKEAKQEEEVAKEKETKAELVLKNKQKKAAETIKI